jgi:glycosyltransferase involved in cell wall biosynthesis
VFVFPSFFEGFGLVVLEAMACGLPVIASDASAGTDVLTASCGQVVPRGDRDALVDSLRWFDAHREGIPAMSDSARKRAETFTWDAYRRAVSASVAPFV